MLSNNIQKIAIHRLILKNQGARQQQQGQVTSAIQTYQRAIGLSPNDAEAHYNLGSAYEDVRKVVMGELRRHFRPEFLNRVDETVVFHPLGTDQLTKNCGLVRADHRAKFRRLPVWGAFEGALQGRQDC